MYDADAIEAINFEQLATVTDRLLLRGAYVSKRRPSVPSLVLHRPLARGSAPYIEQTMVVRPVAAPRIEQTAVARSNAAPKAQVFAITVVIPTLVGIAVGLAAML
jgi:hypothetical protein